MSKFKSTVVFAAAFLILAYFYSDVLFHPNDYIFSPGGDGIKNYYTYIFHAKYDADFWNFGGMNYPYYEHIVYTDGHPLLSWLIGVFGLAEYGIGILNFLMLISFPICAVFLYKILNHFGVKNGWAMVAAIAIAFMSPQVYRMTGHLSLAYVFAIPALWWLMIKCQHGKAIFWSVCIAIYCLVFFFTHPYLGMILCFFSLFFWLVNTLWNRRKWKQNIVYIFIQVLLPIILFQGLVALTDTHENRVGQPGGFFDYYASWKSIFVPHDGPLAKLTHILKIDVGNWESWNYVGLTTTVFAWFIFIYLIRNRKTLDFKRMLRSELAMFMLAAYLILLFAFCFPLKYDFMRWIVDLVGPLKQFRVLGRFGWIFFYVFTVFSVVGFYKIYLKQQRKWPMLLVFCAGILFYAVEFYPMHKSVSISVSTALNPFDKKNVSEDMRELLSFVDQGDYDALIFLPFQHMSSENVMLLGTEEANYDALLLSYHTRTPLMNSISSRMSLTEAILFNNFFSPEFIEKDLVYELPDSAKILVIKNKDGLKWDERRLVYTTEDAFFNETFKAFHFIPENWNTQYYFNEVLQWEKEATVSLNQGWKSDTASTWFIYESFDDQVGESLGGEGAIHKEKGGYDLIYEFDTKTMSPGKYSVSFWYYLMVDRPDVLAVAEQDSVGEAKSFWYDTFETSQSTHIVENWCQVSMEFEVSPAIEKVNILITGNGNGQPYYIDELLIQKQGESPLFRRTITNNQEYIIYNNYWIKANSFQQKN
ncbi:MAG: hypothetical protein IPG07_15025 [Crocinitomicaceae bacterium]|nr:hypothetical protein [Crocinitomicaceae bacterium]